MRGASDLNAASLLLLVLKMSSISGASHTMSFVRFGDIMRAADPD